MAANAREKGALTQDAPTAAKPRKPKSMSDRANNKSYERIQVAALSLFAEKGVDSTSIRDIGSKANVTTSLLYHYAPSKLQLVYELMSDGMERYQTSAAAARDLSDAPEQRLAGLVTAHIIMHCRNRQLAKLIDNGWRPLPRKEKEIMLKVRDNYSNLWDEVLDQGIKENIFEVADPHLARLAIVQMCSVSTWFSPSGPLTTEVLVQRFGELVFGTVRAKRDGKALRFAELAQPRFDAVMTIVETNHQGAVFGRKR